MFDTQSRVTAPADSAAAVLADAVSERQVADAAEARLLERAATWADLHPPESLHDAATFGPTVPGSEREERIAGIGCPLVAEFCLPELAAALGMSTHAGKRLVGHALELRHRLPRLWARVQAGEVQAWRARRVAEATIHADLTPAGAGFVDRMVAPFASSITTAQLDRVVAEALQRFTPSDTDPDADPNGLEHDPRYVRIDDPLTPYGGTALLRGELDPADARDLETALAARAQQLAEDGCTLPLPVRRAMALADLARQQTALDLSNVEDAPARSRPARQLVLHVHLAAAVTGDSDGTVTFDRLATLEAGQQQVLLDQVRAWCTTSHTTVTLRPVLDLAAQVRTRGYTPTAVLRELVVERDRTCVFPWCSRPARGCQLDHIAPYDPGDPDAQTVSSNLACLCTFHHRLKTHGGWHYKTTAPGEYTWTSPHGHTYTRNHTGTHTHHRHPPRP